VAKSRKADILERERVDGTGYSGIVELETDDGKVIFKAKVNKDVLRTVKESPTVLVRYVLSSPRIALLEGEW
jgi:hypothetical protein